MRTGAISDAQITASSIWDSNHEAFQGRLNFQAIPKSGSWSADINDWGPWLEIFLGGPQFTVSRIATQGSSDHYEWVTEYILEFSDDAVWFEYYREDGGLKVRKATK